MIGEYYCISCVPTPAVFLLFNIFIFWRCNFNLIWTVVKSEMAAATVFVFLVTALNGAPNMVNNDDDPQPMKQPGGVLVTILKEFRKAIEEVAILTSLRKSDYYAIYGDVAFARAEDVFRSEHSSTVWFCHS